VSCHIKTPEADGPAVSVLKLVKLRDALNSEIAKGVRGFAKERVL